MKYERYMVFGYWEYYPAGGLVDCADSFSDKEDAVKYAKEREFDYIEVFDRVEGIEIDWETE